MAHRYVLKDAYWKMRIDHPYSMAAAAADLAVTCGQAPIGETGDVLHPGDLLAQSRQVLETQARIFSDLALGAADLSKIVVFISEQRAGPLTDCERLFRAAAPAGAPVYSVVIPPLFYDQLLIEVDFYATPPRPERSAAPLLRSVALEIEIDRAQSTFPDDLSDATLAALSAALARTGLGLESVVKLSCYAPTADPGFWQALAAQRRRWFKSQVPATSDVVTELRAGSAHLQLDATCVTNGLAPAPIGEPLEPGHPEAVTAGPLVFTSALFSPHTSNGSVAEEVTGIMERHGALLRSGGLSFADVIKANTFYEGSGSAAALQENMQARNAYYRVPGPASTGLPVSAFPTAGKRTSIELIAAHV